MKRFLFADHPERGRLLAIKAMVAGMKDALPTVRAELMREACESLDDLVGEIV